MNPITLRVHAGEHERRFAPVSAALSETPGPGNSGTGRLTLTSSGKQLAHQVDGDRLWFIVDKLKAGQTLELRYEPQSSGKRASGVRFKSGDGALDVSIKGRPFTTYHYGDAPRPYLHPLLGPEKTPVTRAFPMAQRDGERTDHKHHRSLWMAHGDISSADNWSEEEGHAWQQHQNVDETSDGPVVGRLVTTNQWQDKDRNPQLTERRTLQFYATPDTLRLFDVTVEFKATHGPVTFGDTKEGGIVAVRVATTMDGDKGGRIENSIGGIGEKECWGRPAHWVDYSGPIDGNTMGIAIFDHPMNLRHPTPWHVRNYGLFAANPFALHDYKQSLQTDGSHRLDEGQTLTFRYRLLVHRGDAKKGRVGEHYHDYVNPPMVEIVGAEV